MVRSTGTFNGQPVVVEGVEIYTVNDNPPEGVELDPYFSHQSPKDVDLAD